MQKPQVLMALMFFPRGGSAQVTRYLAGALPPHGWNARVLAGSLGAPGDESHAPTFFEGLDVVPVPYDEALNAAPDPLRADPPMHPSFEDRPDAPDRVFAAWTTRRTSTWSRRGSTTCARRAPATPTSCTCTI